MGGSRLLYFLKCKNGTRCKNFAEYIHSFVFPEMAGRGLQPPLETP